LGTVPLNSKKKIAEKILWFKFEAHGEGDKPSQIDRDGHFKPLPPDHRHISLVSYNVSPFPNGFWPSGVFYSLVMRRQWVHHQKLHFFTVDFTGFGLLRYLNITDGKKCRDCGAYRVCAADSSVHLQLAIDGCMAVCSYIYNAVMCHVMV
jgi:hypothetical protein